MAREDILREVQETLGTVPEWFAGIPDPQLEHLWALWSWEMSDTALSEREKALVGFGAAAAVHCGY